PVLKNNSTTQPAPSQVTIARPSARTAIAMTVVATPTEMITGTNTNGTAADQPWAKRKPKATPNTVSTTAEPAVRMASASSRPVSALARWVGNVQSLVNRPDSRSAGSARPAPRVPKTAPTTAHMGTSPYRLSVPVMASTALPMSSLYITRRKVGNNNACTATIGSRRQR